MNLLNSVIDKGRNISTLLQQYLGDFRFRIYDISSICVLCRTFCINTFGIILSVSKKKNETPPPPPYLTISVFSHFWIGQDSPPGPLNEKNGQKLSFGE